MPVLGLASCHCRYADWRPICITDRMGMSLLVAVPNGQPHTQIRNQPKTKRKTDNQPKQPNKTEEEKGRKGN